MSGVRPLNKSAKPGPGRPRTRPIDPNWDGLKAIEERIYQSIPVDVDADDFNDKINAVREARESGDARTYATALRDLISFHYDSFKAESSYSSTEIDRALKADELLSSDPKALAFARGILHGKDRSGTSVKTLAESLEDAKSNFRTNRADVRSHISALGDDWDTKGAIDLAKDLETEFTEEFKRQGAHDAEAEFRAKRKVIQTLNQMSNDPQRAFVLLTSKNQNASIKLYMDGKSSKMTPIIDADEITKIRDGILAARANRFNKDPINVNVMSNDTVGGIPQAVSDQLEDGDLAFTYFGGDGVYIYPEKMKKLLAEGIDADWFSTETLDSADLYKHLIVHETGHLQMYKLWGDGTGTGRQALEKDFAAFKVKKNGTSIYGNESISESFAEQYAKYLITGNASPEFLELLSSKGLAKAQLNKKWRDNHPNLQRSKIFTFLDGILSDDQGGVIPEYNGPEASEFQPYQKYGASKVHKLGRILGFASNKPTTVTAINDDKYVVYRGLSAGGTRATETAWGYHNNTRTDDMPYYGYGIYGDGLYTSTKRSTAESFGSDAVAKMRIKPDAKVYSDGGRGLNNLFFASTSNDGYDINEIAQSFFSSGGFLEEFILNEIDPDLDPAELRAEKRRLYEKMGLSFGVGDANLAIIAGMLGFQGYEVSRGSSESYVVVLDRSMLEMMVPPGFKD